MEKITKFAKNPWVLMFCTATICSSLIALGRMNDLSKSDWSSWVQAIGSIGAIVGTWYATRIQLDHAARNRLADKLDNEVANAQVAFDLASDTSNALHHVRRKFQYWHSNSTPTFIGTERLDGISKSLQSFGSRPISPKLYAEVLCLQREVSYSITAINQQNAALVISPERLQKAVARCSAVFDCIQRIENILVESLHAAGCTNYVIQRTGGAEERGNEY